MFLKQPAVPEAIEQTLRKLAQFPAARDGVPVKLLEQATTGAGSRVVESRVGRLHGAGGVAWPSRS